MGATLVYLSASAETTSLTEDMLLSPSCTTSLLPAPNSEPRVTAPPTTPLSEAVGCGVAGVPVALITRTWDGVPGLAMHREAAGERKKKKAGFDLR